MTVQEVIEALSQYDPTVNVYVPDLLSDRAEIAQSVSQLLHVNLPPGIQIPPDVCMTPWTEDEFQKLFGQKETLT